MAEKSKRTKLIEGQVLRVDLKDGTHVYARVLHEPLIAFYDRLYHAGEELDTREVLALPIAFKIWVMNYAVTKGIWKVIGCIPLSSDLKESPKFFKQDPINGDLAIYQSAPELSRSYERPATLAECQGLESAAVWDPEHVEERLRDHFAGRHNRWVEQPKTPQQFREHQQDLMRRREAHRGSTKLT